MTITQVSKQFDISTRTLRYYEQRGLLQSHRRTDYAYRVYEEDDLRRLGQILLLRKLRIPLRQIEAIFSDNSLLTLLDALQQNMRELDGEITALSTIRSLLFEALQRLTEGKDLETGLKLLGQDQTIRAIEALSKIKLREDYSMKQLDQANELLSKLKNTRILYLSPATVAAAQYTGPNPEDISGDRLAAFIRDKDLCQVKPDFRVYGFNDPSPSKQGEIYGYSLWVTIPEDMDVPAPLEKKWFAGGLYAAHSIKMGDFHEWAPFCQYMERNGEYAIDPREPLGMSGFLEEHINAYTYYKTNRDDFGQLDLLIPVKEKS